MKSIGIVKEFGKTSYYSTLNVLGRDVKTSELLSSYNERTGLYDISNRIKVKLVENEYKLGTKDRLDFLKARSFYYSFFSKWNKLL
jgi:hypothetical protein